MKKLVLFITFLALICISVYGIKNPWNENVVQKTGNFTLSPYKYGLYISPTSGIFYNFSPYDAYFKYSETSTEKFVDIKEGLIAKELNIKRSLLQTKYEAILSYFGLADPVVTFANKGTSFAFKSHIEENEIEVWIENVPERFRQNTIVMTMTFDENDYLFDIEKNLYFSRGPSKAEEFIELYGVPLKPLEQENDKVLLTKPTIIANNSYNGAILINPNSAKYEAVYLNKPYRIIEFELKPGENRITVEVFDSVKELL